MDLRKIQDIIFDLGGVIIGLDVRRTVSKMAELMHTTELEAQSVFESKAQFKAYEMGRMTDRKFRDFIRSLAPRPVSDSAIDTAWNAMILDIPDNHFELLSRLSKKYRVHLLSNTNNIHLQCVKQKLELAGRGQLAHYFHREFYSHKMGMRKPNRNIYEQVLKAGEMEAEATLFLDDNLDNLAGAKSLGIQVKHVRKLTDTANFFNER
ncbi:MAG: HAD-IA family hydrolase [Bacteroidota bacterium]